MKKKLLDALSIGSKAIFENLYGVNHKLVQGVLIIHDVINRLYNGKHLDEQVTLIYYGDNPLTFLMLFVTAYLCGYKVIKVVSVGELQSKIFRSINPTVFVDKEYYSNEVTEMMRFKPFVAFHTHNLSLMVKMTLSQHIGIFDLVKQAQIKYSNWNHECLMEKLKDMKALSPLYLHTHIVMELPTSGIHSPESYIGFSKDNIDSIVKVISCIPGLLTHDVIRIFSTIESSFFYMLSGYVNQKTVLTNINSRGDLNVHLYSRSQIALIDGNHLMYLWNVLLKEIICSNTYNFFNRNYLRWVVGLKIRSLLRSLLGRSLKSLYVINADIPHDLKQLLRNSFLKVGFLYGIRETGNIIGSNFKKDNISLDSYKIENTGDDITVEEDSETGVLFVKGDAVADSIPREYNSNAVKEEDFFISTQDIASVKKDTINFLSPVGTALSIKDRLNFDLYFAEKTLLLLPEVLHSMSFEYQNNWYIGVRVDVSHLDKININPEDVAKKLNGIRVKMNAYLPLKNHIRGIHISTEELILNKEGVPVRFFNKMVESI